MLDSIVKTEKKQGFTAVDMILCLCLIAAVSLIVFPVILKSSSKEARFQAQQEAQKLSIKLIRNMRGPEAAKRQLASSKNAFEGLISSDPWGNPYHYRVLRDIYGHPSHIVVWSRGFNSSQDTAEEEFYSEDQRVRFAGDDIGYVRPL